MDDIKVSRVIDVMYLSIGQVCYICQKFGWQMPIYSKSDYLPLSQFIKYENDRSNDFLMHDSDFTTHYGCEAE